MRSPARPIRRQVAEVLPNPLAEPVDPGQLDKLRRDFNALAERLAKVEQRLSEL